MRHWDVSEDSNRPAVFGTPRTAIGEIDEALASVVARCLDAACPGSMLEQTRSRASRHPGTDIQARGHARLRAHPVYSVAVCTDTWAYRRSARSMGCEPFRRMFCASYRAE